MNKMKTIEEQTPYERTERIEYGTLREVTKQTQKIYKWKGSQIAYASAKNLKNEGAPLMLVIAEVDPEKPAIELAEKTVWVSREVSEMLREGVVKLEACYDLIVIEHTNKNPAGDITSKPYPLCIRPSKDNTALRDKLRANGVNSDVKSVYSWEDNTEDVNIDDYITLG